MSTKTFDWSPFQIAGKINRFIREYGLRDIGQLEQDLVFGDAGAKEVISILRSKQVCSERETKNRLAAKSLSIDFVLCLTCLLLSRIWVQKTNWGCWLYMQLYIQKSLKVTKGKSWCRYLTSIFDCLWAIDCINSARLIQDAKIYHDIGGNLDLLSLIMSIGHIKRD